MAVEIRLTEKQKEVLQYIADGKDDKTIAKNLGCSFANVRRLVMSLFDKFNLSTETTRASRASLVYIAFKEGLID